MSATYTAVMAELARGRQRELRDEATRRRASVSFRQSIGRALIDWGIRLSQDARPLTRSRAPR